MTKEEQSKWVELCTDKLAEANTLMEKAHEHVNDIRALAVCMDTISDDDTWDACASMLEKCLTEINEACDTIMLTLHHMEEKEGSK